MLRPAITARAGTPTAATSSSEGYVGGGRNAANSRIPAEIRAATGSSPDMSAPPEIQPSSRLRHGSGSGPTAPSETATAFQVIRPNRQAGSSRLREATFSGACMASRKAVHPPIDTPRRCVRSRPSPARSSASHTPWSAALANGLLCTERPGSPSRSIA